RSENTGERLGRAGGARAVYSVRACPPALKRLRLRAGGGEGVIGTGKHDPSTRILVVDADRSRRPDGLIAAIIVYRNSYFVTQWGSGGAIGIEVAVGHLAAE
nr:hypothetical protein [Tanacetum cinerariifolium]